MNKNKEKQTMRLSTTPMQLYKRTNEKSRKTNRSISDESVQKCTSLNGNSMYLRDRSDAMTRNPKKQIIELNKLMSGNPRISTPTNGNTGEQRHDVVNARKLCVRIQRLLYQRYIESCSHYLTGNDKLFTPYPRRGNKPRLSKFLQISGFTSSKMTFLSAQTDLKIFNFSQASRLDLN